MTTEIELYRGRESEEVPHVVRLNFLRSTSERIVKTQALKLLRY